MNDRKSRGASDALAAFARADLARSVWQLLSSLTAFVLCWSLSLFCLRSSFGLAMLAAAAASIFMVRLFIIQHDCGHGSFFSSRRANEAVGAAIGVLTLTPFADWRRQHAAHHATSGNLDERGAGDINTLTVREYLALTPLARLRYRFFRHPVVLFVIGPAYQFFLRHRLPARLGGASRQEWVSVLGTNVAAALLVLVAGTAVGWNELWLVQMPISWMASAAGVWLFYVQHQFEHTYWRDAERWDFEESSIAGSSFYDLPAVLHWCTGNIGFHHIHHLCPRIPNYRLPHCVDAHPDLRRVTRLTLAASLKTARLKLWDEDQHRLVDFSRRSRIETVPVPE